MAGQKLTRQTDEVIVSYKEVDSAASRKFCNPLFTADGAPRARVAMTGLRTLWFNTGTRCNLACGHCYIESSPNNDRLVYLTAAEVQSFLDEIAVPSFSVQEIGFTGGEPFLNPDFLKMLSASLESGYSVLVLTNAMQPMMKHASGLLDLQKHHGDNLVIRVSIDHFSRSLHEEERGSRSWQPMLRGLLWLNSNGFNVRVAGRLRWGDDEATMREGFHRLFHLEGIEIDAMDPTSLVLFPEMDEQIDTPEISVDCCDVLGVRTEELMCASSRMVVKHRGADRPVVVSCTLLPYSAEFNLGHRLSESLGDISLNHPYCSAFCVLGGGNCSG